MVKGFRDEYHPNRQVGRERFATPPIDDFGGGDFPGWEPPQPPPGPIDRAGAWGNPRAIVAPMSDESSQGEINAAYNAIRASTDLTGTEANQMIRDATRPYNTMGQISTGIMTQQQAAARHPPLSEQQGHGIFAHREPLEVQRPLENPLDPFLAHPSPSRVPPSAPLPLRSNTTGEIMETEQQVTGYGPVADIINRTRQTVS